MAKIIAMIATNIAWWMIPIDNEHWVLNGLMMLSILAQAIGLFRRD